MQFENLQVVNCCAGNKCYYLKETLAFVQRAGALWTLSGGRVSAKVILFLLCRVGNHRNKFWGRKRHTRKQGMVMDFDEQLHTLEEVWLRSGGWVVFTFWFWVAVDLVFCGLLLDCSCGFCKCKVVVSVSFWVTGDW